MASIRRIGSALALGGVFTVFAAFACTRSSLESSDASAAPAEASAEDGGAPQCPWGCGEQIPVLLGPGDTCWESYRNLSDAGLLAPDIPMARVHCGCMEDAALADARCYAPLGITVAPPWRYALCCP